MARARLDGCAPGSGEMSEPPPEGAKSLLGRPGERLQREKVYDPVLRSIHAWNALAIVFLLMGGRIGDLLGYVPEAAVLWRLHVWCGYALVFGLIARLVWGVAGPHHAHLGVFWQPRVWWCALRARALFSSPTDWGHHPPAAAIYLLFYLLVLVMAVTGLALAAIDQGRGPLYLWLGHDVSLKQIFRAPHAWLEYVILGFVGVHIGALILHEIRHGLPMAQAMVSGYQYRKVAEEEE